jgi:2-polyprenyl-6-methoxyphenol hydroxylase-like FAD-dependent oxidoreductase
MGRFLGIYPVKGRYGIFAGGPTASLHPDRTEGRATRIKTLLAPFQGKARAVLDALPDDHADVFFWDLADTDSREWAKGRVVLCGDAAAGFLPTAGIGASMAMESASVLADELSRADAAHIGNALDLYAVRRRKRVEGMQADSRHLAKMMLVESLPLAWTRDQLMRFYSIDMLIKNIAKSFSHPI